MPVKRYELVLDLDESRKVTDAVVYGFEDWGDGRQEHFVTSFSTGPFDTNTEAVIRCLQAIMRDLTRGR